MKVSVWILKVSTQSCAFMCLQLNAPHIRWKHELSLTFAAQKEDILGLTCSGCAQGTPGDAGHNCGVEQALHPSAKGLKGRCTKTSLPLISLVHWLDAPSLFQVYLGGLPLTALWLWEFSLNSFLWRNCKSSSVMSVNVIILISAAMLQSHTHPYEFCIPVRERPCCTWPRWVWTLTEYEGIIKQEFTRALNKPLSDEWKIKPGTVVLWLNSYSLLDSCSEFKATQLAPEMMGWGTFYYQRSFQSLEHPQRTTLHYITEHISH